MKRLDERAVPEIVVEVRGGIADDLADYARRKVTTALTHIRRPVPRVHVRVVTHCDPARTESVTAHVNVDVDGRPLLVHCAAASPRKAVDVLVERLEHRLDRLSRDHRPRHERAHLDGQVPPFDEPEIVRHAMSSTAAATAPTG